MKDMMQYTDFVDSDKGQDYLAYHGVWKDAYLAYVKDYIEEFEGEVTDAIHATVAVLEYGKHMRTVVDRAARIRFA
jgi:hypothetical protein